MCARGGERSAHEIHGENHDADEAEELVKPLAVEAATGEHDHEEEEGCAREHVCSSPSRADW